MTGVSGRLTAARRAYLYRVALAVVAVAGVYGLVDGVQSASIVALVAAVLGQGVAVAHTSTRDNGAT